MLLLLALPTLAADLSAQITTSEGTRQSVTFHDVEITPPPPLMMQLRGADVLVTISVVPQDETWKVTATVAKLGKRGKQTVIASPTILVHANEPGRVEQGQRIPLPDTDPVAYREEFWRLDIMVYPS